MKAKIFLGGALAALVLGMTACSIDEIVQSNPAMDDTEAIIFKATLGHSTRAAAITSNELREFSVWGWNDDGLFMDHAFYYYTHDAYECDDLYLWPQAGANFMALIPAVSEEGGSFYLGGEVEADDVAKGDAYYTGHVAQATIDPVNGTAELAVDTPADNADQVDICYAVAVDNAPNSYVTLNFRHALSQVAFKAKNTNPDMTIDIAGVTLHSISKTGKYTLPAVNTTPNLSGDNGTTNPASGTQGTWTVSNAITGSAFSAGMAKEYETLSTDTTRVSLLSEDGALFLIPQKTDKWDVENDATQSNGGAYFLINCRITEFGSQLWPATVGDFGEVAIPVDIDWEEGYRYTYTFIFGYGAGYYPPDDPTKPGDPIFSLIDFVVTVDEFQDADGIDVSTEVEDYGEGTVDNPYPVSTALRLINAGVNTDDMVYVKGIISEITEITPLLRGVTEGHATYYMSDDGETDEQIMVFDGLSLGGVEFTSSDEIAVGDEVVVYGILATDEEETPEIDSSIIYSINGETYEEPEPEEEGELVYGNDFDATVVTGNTNITDATTVYMNEEGSGIGTVTYGYSGTMSVRVSSNSSGYTNASGNNNIFFGNSANEYFIIKDITLPTGETDFNLAFGALENASFSHDTFKVYVSEDKLSWVEVSYEFENGNPSSNSWGLASTTFTVPSGTETLSIYYEATKASAYRIDDVRFTVASEAGTTIDFSTGVELTGGDQEPEEYELVGNGTVDNPYTAADANWLATSGEYTSDEVYVKGIISQIDELSTSYGNATYYISDDGSTTGQFEIYRGYSLGGQRFTSEDEIKVGDEVVVCGVITLYGSTAEMTTGSSIYSINGQTYETPDTGDLEGDGTVDNPYSTSEALAIINAGTYTSSNVYVSGTISKIDEIDTSSYGNATYYISDDGTTSNQLEVYRGYSLGGVKFTSSDEIKVGDEVVVYGQLTMFYSTPEITTGSIIYSLNGKTYDAPEVGGTTGSGTIDDPYTASDALSIIAENPSYSQYVYITGTVSRVASLNSSYNELNYYISDDGTTTNELYVYCGYGLNGEKIYSADYLKAGDVVVIYGQLTTYNGSAEVNMRSTIISINGSTTGGDSGDGDTGGTGDLDSDSFVQNVTWSDISSSNSSYNEKAYINGGSSTVDICRVGKSGTIGHATCTIPTGTKSVQFYCIAWNNGGPAPFTVTVGTDGYSYEATAHSGLANNSPYTISDITSSDYFEITFDSALTADTTVTVETTSASKPRVAFIGFKYITD